MSRGRDARTSIVALSLVAILVLFSIAVTPVSAKKKDRSNLSDITVMGDVVGSGTGVPRKSGFAFDDGKVCFGDVDGSGGASRIAGPLFDNTCYDNASGRVGGRVLVVQVNEGDTLLFVMDVGGGERSRIDGGFMLTFSNDVGRVFFGVGGDTHIHTPGIWTLTVTVVDE